MIWHGRHLLWTFAMTLALLAPMGAARAQDAPQVQAQARIEPAGPANVGATVALQVDVLTTTWFTQPPELPALQLPGALVMAPPTHAELIRTTVNGTAYSGLRYAYQISPTQPGTLSIPALHITLHVGQAAGPVQASTSPLTLSAIGAAQGQGQGLVATALTATQDIQYSHQPLRVGDRIVRQITIQAPGAQAMLIPTPQFAQIDGLKRYLDEPQVTPLLDGRGGFLGGQRVDRAEYLVDRAGSYALPAMTIAWRNASTGSEERVVLPAQSIKAEAAPAYQAPFSVAEDLRKLGSRATLHLSAGMLTALAAALVLALCAWLGYPWWRRLGLWLREQTQHVIAAWRTSEACAWLALRRWLKHPVERLDALYRWLWRAAHARTVAAATAGLPAELAEPPARLLRDRYGKTPAANNNQRALLPAARRLRHALNASAKKTPGGLLPLNPSPSSARASRISQENRNE